MDTIKKILELAENRGITQGKLAYMLGVNEYIIDDWKSKIRCPTIAEIVTIADYFGGYDGLFALKDETDKPADAERERRVSKP